MLNEQPQTKEHLRWWRAMQGGDQQAMKRLFEAYYQALCAYAFRWMNSHSAVEELVQDLFCDLWEKRGRNTEIQSVKAYLYRSVQNRCLSALRHQSVREVYAQSEIKRHLDADLASDMRDFELEDTIQETLTNLPDQCRIVFEMSRFEGKKYREIAEALDISVKTVENHMGKALSRFRTVLQDYLPLFILFSGLLPFLFKSLTV